MVRFLVVLLLSLALWPSPAAASPGAPVDDQDYVTATTVEYMPEGIRSPTGLELLSQLEHRCGGNCSQRRTSGPADEYVLASGYESLRAALRLLLGDSAPEAEEPAVPLCETFPYYATAPPSLR